MSFSSHPDYHWNREYTQYFRGRLAEIRDPGDNSLRGWMMQIVDTADSGKPVVWADEHSYYNNFEVAMRDLTYAVAAYRVSHWFYIDNGIRNT